MKTHYRPVPIVVEDISLSVDVLELVGLIAENVHEIWAAARIADGWVYGEERNDVKKEHPCLVPYTELSESEKEYDRNTAMGALKLICKLGYTITKSN